MSRADHGGAPRVDDDCHPSCPSPVGLVTTRTPSRRGRCGPDARVLRGPAWLHPQPRPVVPADDAADGRATSVEAACGSRDGLVTGLGRAPAGGRQLLRGTRAGSATPLPVPVLLPHEARIRGREVLVERHGRRSRTAVPGSGVRALPSNLALLHEVRRATVARAAGVMVDMALAADVVDVERLREAASRSDGSTAAAAYALDRACAECRSPGSPRCCRSGSRTSGFPDRS